jgi:hypothetical protein
MSIALFLKWIIKQYDLHKYILSGFIYLEMRHAILGLPQAGILANKLLLKRLLTHAYYICANMPGLWKHKTQPILFTLVVNNFGVKYVRKEHVKHLIACIKETYKLTKDWTGNLYCGIKLNWDYDARTLDISMPGYIQNCCLNISILCRQNPNIAHTLLLQNNMERQPNPPSPSISCPSSPPMKSKKFNGSSEAYCIMPARSISLS